MKSSTLRHDASLPHYRERLNQYEAERHEDVEQMVTAPFAAKMSLNSIALNARVALTVDPNAADVITWRFWSTWMQASEAIFAMSTAPAGTTVERHIDHQARTLSAISPGSESGAGTWLTAFSLAVSCRDEGRVRFLR